jgi:tetratricopeptide (TPR) repeat protein
LAEALRVRFAAYKALKQPEAAAAEIERFLDASPESSGGGGGGGTGGAIVPMMESLQREVQALIDDGKDSDATDLARRTLLPVAKIVEQRVATMPGSPRDHAIVEQKIADAYRLSGENLSAVAIYERLLVSQPDATPLLMGRAECLYQLGGEERLAEAMNVYKRIAAAGTSAGAENYWLSQLRMLQVLDTINRNTAQIVPRIERLRQQDPNFGGERFRRGFDYLRQKWQGK